MLIFKKLCFDLIDFINASERDCGEGLKGKHVDGGGHAPLPATLVVRSQLLQLERNHVLPNLSYY